MHEKFDILLSIALNLSFNPYGPYEAAMKLTEEVVKKKTYNQSAAEKCPPKNSQVVFSY